MKEIMFSVGLLFASHGLAAVDLKPGEIYTPVATPAAAAKADVLSDKYLIYTDGPFRGERSPCTPCGIDDPVDRALVKSLPYEHIVCSDLIELTELLPQWAEEYNRQVLQLLKARAIK